MSLVDLPGEDIGGSGALLFCLGFAPCFLYLVSSVEGCSPTVFSEADAGKETSQTAGTGVVCLLPVFTLLGAFSVLVVSARVIGPGEKGLPGESEVRTFVRVGPLGGEVVLLYGSASRLWLGGSVDRELLECGAGRELVGGSEDRELLGGILHCVGLGLNDNRDSVDVCISRGPTEDLLGEDLRKLAFLISCGVHVMKRLVALGLTGLISSKSFDLPLFGENTFHLLILNEERRRPVVLNLSTLSSASSRNGFKCSG